MGRHLGKHLPGKPTVVVQNMPGGGSYTAANHIFSVAPKDGTAIALISGEAALGPITGASGRASIRPNSRGSARHAPTPICA